MSKFQKFSQIEKSLEQKFKNARENEVTLSEDDFKDEKLSMFGYVKLKQQCEYIEFNEDIEIKVPNGKTESFKESVEYMASSELRHIKKDMHETQIISLACLLIGICFLGLGQLFSEIYLMSEITLIATWVFVWTAVEKWFFGRKRLVERKLSILHILSAKIIENSK